MRMSALLLLLSLSSVGWAEERSPTLPAGETDEFNQCMDRSGGVTMEMLACIGAETKRQDVRLNEVYKKLMQSLSKQRKTQLRAAQRLWIKYRDENCKFYLDPEGGSMARVIGAGCFMDMTTERAKELADILGE